MIKKKQKLSSTGRAKLKKRQDKISQLCLSAERLVEQLYFNVEQISVEEFDAYWNILCSSIKDLADGKDGDYRLVFIHVVKQVKNIIKAREWRHIHFEVYLVQVQKEAALRNLEWINDARQLFELHKYWLDSHIQNGLPTDKSDAFHALIFSLMCHSSVCRVNYLFAIIQQIQKKPEVRLFNNLPFVSFQYASTEKHYTNDRNKRGEKIFSGRVFLSPLTLRLLNHYLAIGDEVTFPNDTYALIKEIKDYLKRFMEDFDFARHHVGKCIFVTENMGCDIPQPLIHFAIGNINSSGLPRKMYQNVPANTIKPFSFLDVNIGLEHSKQSVDENQDEPKTKRLMSEPMSTFFYALRDVLRRESQHQKTKRTELVAKLEALLPTADFAQTWLVEWYLQLLQRNEPSTVRTYHSNIGRLFLAGTDGELLQQFTPEDFEELYVRQINNEKKMKYEKSQRLLQLHRFGEQRYGLARISDREVFAEIDASGTHVRAGFIQETLFKQLLANIDNLYHCEPVMKKIIQGLVIVCYRCGLRISEARKLRRKDIETGFTTTWAHIRSNKYDNNKTYHSTRKVPLSVMLLPDELAVMDTLVNTKLTGESLIFSRPSSPTKVINEQHLRSIVQYYLRGISENASYVLHHLRHSYASRMQLMLVGESNETLPEYIAYSPAQCRRILAVIIDNNEHIEYALAKSLGHGEPNITYNNYYHFTDYALGKVVINSNHKLDKQSALALFGIGRRRFADLSADGVHIEVRQALAKEIKACTVIVKPKKAKAQTETEQSTYQPNKQFEFGLANYLLTLYAEGNENVEDFTALYDAKTHLGQWIENAKAVKAHYVTDQGLSRLFAKDKANQLVPAPLIHENDLAFYQQLVAKVMELFAKATDSEKQAFYQMVDYALSNSRVSKSGIRFTAPDKLSTFLKVVEPLIPTSNWEATLTRTKGSKHDKAWRSATQKLKKKQEGKGSKSHSGEVRLKLFATKKGAPRPKSASYAFMFMCHMLAITQWEEVGRTKKS